MMIVPSIVQDLTARFARVGGAESEPTAPLAIFTVHGMGEQVRFEEIDKIVRMLEAEGPSNWFHVSTAATIAAPNGNPLPRAEMTFRSDAGKERRVHVYEAYWAPITEGRVTLKDAVDFLAQAGWDGVKYARQRVFDRFEFGVNQRYPVSRRLVTWFVFILAIIGALILANSALTVLIAGSSFFGLDRGRFTPEVVMGCTAVLAIVLLFGLIMGMSFAMDARKEPADGQKTAAAKPFGRSRSSFLMVLTLALLVIAAIVVSVILIWPQEATGLIGRWWSVPYEGAAATALLVGKWIVLGASFLVAKGARDWLVGYVGDLAAYLSAHKASKFDELRNKVQDAAYRVLRDVYAGGEGGVPLYPKVMVIGHSLGSVIAYDTLNAVMRRQILFPAEFAGAESVAERTHLFLTCGSPLDTTAFIFRSQTNRNALVRDMLACAMQPLITDLPFRELRWVNIWTHMDPISGRLSFYDPLAAPPGFHKVENLLDDRGIVPFVCHSDYFQHPVLKRVVAASIADAWSAPSKSSTPSAQKHHHPST